MKETCCVYISGSLKDAFYYDVTIKNLVRDNVTTVNNIMHLLPYGKIQWEKRIFIVTSQ